MNEAQILEKLEQVKRTLEGLRVEIEGWRKHTSSTGEFMIDTLEDLQRTVRDLISKVAKKGG